MSFAHLHVNATYSLFDGLSSISELFDKADSLRQTGLAITDHYDRHIKDSDHKKYSHLILLAQNQTGYRNLLKICSEAAVSGQYRGKPMQLSSST